MSGTVTRIITGIFNMMPNLSGSNRGALNIPPPMDLHLTDGAFANLQKKLDGEKNRTKVNIAKQLEYEQEFDLYKSYADTLGKDGKQHKWVEVLLLRTPQPNPEVRQRLQEAFPAPNNWVTQWWPTIYSELMAFESDNNCKAFTAYGFGTKHQGAWYIAAMFFEGISNSNNVTMHHRSLWIDRSLRAGWDDKVWNTIALQAFPQFK